MSRTDSADWSPQGSPRFVRPNLRQATLILPRTGERVKRTITLRQSPRIANGDSADDDRTPLLLCRRLPWAQQSSWKRWESKTVENAQASWNFARSKTGQGILKCSLAYLLGSMATFVPAIAALLGQQDGKHIVATITVYFHPARSQGSMHEATLLAVVATLYAMFVSFTSMGVSIGFADLDLITLGHVVVLLVFCGGGLGFVGWLKQRLGSPLVNVACSLTSLAIITVLTKEGAVQAAEFSDDKVVQVLKMVLMGIFATTAVCLIINPISARKELRESMIDVTDAFGDMLSIITRSFLSGSDEEMRRKTFTKSSERYKLVFGGLTKNLREAKFEHYAFGTEDEYQFELKIVNSLQRLAQNIGGLRSAAMTEFNILQSVNMGASTPVFSYPSTLLSPDYNQPGDHVGILTSIDEVSESDSHHERSMRDTPIESSDDLASLPTVTTPVEIFGRFITQLGPSMKSLAFTLKQILDELPFGPGPEYKITVDHQFRKSLDDATELYTKARTESLTLLYKSNELNKDRPLAIAADFEEVAASCGYFSISLQDFAEEMKVYLDILDEHKLQIQKSSRRSWKWLLFWRAKKDRANSTAGSDPERNTLVDRNEEIVMPEGVPSPHEGEGSILSNEQPSRKEQFNLWLWRTFRVFRRDDVKFAIKVGVGASLYALPSFISYTRPFYSHWRGEWGLLSYMLVCSMTIGASNTTGYQRFLGTCIGAVLAILGWFITRGNPIALAIFGWAISLGCFHIIVAQGKGPMGRFILLTYNLSALYAYSLSVKDGEDDEDEGGTNPRIAEITLHRVIAVMSGCVWGLIITRMIWPISARQKFKSGLSLLWLRMGLIWKRDPLSVLLEGESPNPYMNIREEFELQRFLVRLDNLRKAASSEFELRGPFPDQIYGKILKSTNSMLDAFHAMNVVILKDLKASEGEAEILKYTAKERSELSARISHLFQVLASSMKLEFPLNDALPSIEHTRDRLLAKIFEYRKTTRAKDDTLDDEDFALLYAYALVTGQLSQEIAKVGTLIEKLFGVFDEDLLKLE